jgi:hypothetical protein
MLEKAKELQRLRIEAKKQPSKNINDFAGGFGSSSSSMSAQRFQQQTSMEPSKNDVVQPPSFSSSSGKPNNAMKLGGKVQLPAFLEQTVRQTLPSNTSNTNNSFQSSSTPAVNQEKYVLMVYFNYFYFFKFRVHLKMDEKITVTCGKDGGLQNLEVHGILLLRVANEIDGKIKVHIQNTDSRNIQLQVDDLILLF